MDKTKPVEITSAEEDLVVMMRDFNLLFNRSKGDPTIETAVYWNRDEQRWEMKVEGFYKHGHVTVFREPGQDFAVRGFSYNEYKVMGRYGELDTIRDFDDLIGINFAEWTSYRDSAPGWNTPDAGWLPHLIGTGRVTKRVETVTHYEVNNAK